MSLSRSAAIARHELRLLRADPFYLVVFTTMPLVVMAFVKPSFRYALAAQGHPDANGAEQAVPGMAVMFTLFLLGNVGFAFYREHGWRTWERLRASWARPAEIMTGKVVVPLLIAVLQLVVLFGIGGLIYDLRVEGSLLALVVVAAAYCVTIVSIGLALLAVCRSVMQVNAVANLGAMVLAGIGGAIAPAAALPGWAKSIAPSTPSYWAMRGFRSVILDGGGLSAVLLPAAVLSAFSLAALVIATRRFRFEDTKAFFA